MLVCSKFGCGRILSNKDSLYGTTCLIHSSEGDCVGRSTAIETLKKEFNLLIVLANNKVTLLESFKPSKSVVINAMQMSILADYVCMRDKLIDLQLKIDAF